jgi:uncharacterized protein
MRVWIDCTAAAHPLVMRPIIERLRERGDEVAVTAREYGQMVGILERLGIDHVVVGRHADTGTTAKGLAVASRSAALVRWARSQRFELALAHGSVDIAVVSTLLRIPLVEMQDYEHAGLQRHLAFRAARRVLVPDAIPVAAMRRAGAAPRKLWRYAGLKEDYYLADFAPDGSVVERLGVDSSKVLAVVRPPPETSAYHADNPLYEQVVARLADEAQVATVVIPRTERQRAALPPTFIVPSEAIDAQSLIACADLVIGAGGTMNREAVALGTPVWTLFSGRMGAVDEAVIQSGAMRQLRDPGELELRKRELPIGPRHPRDPGQLVTAIVGAAGGTE